MTEAPTALSESPAAESAAQSNIDASGQPNTPICLVVDPEQSIRRFISLILHGFGINTVEYANAAAFAEAPMPQAPDLVLHDVSLDLADSVKLIMLLAQRSYGGPVQLMSSRGGAVLDHVKSVGLKHKLNMLPVLKKPFGVDAIVKIIQDLKIGYSFAGATRIDIDKAFSNNWIEFWYQPVISLRKKQLAGAEAFCRVRHPNDGIALPAAFLPGATDSAVLNLSEMAVSRALETSLNFSKLGVHLPIAVNIPIEVIEKLPVGELIASRNLPEKWGGLIIDIVEEQVINNLTLAKEMAQKFKPINVNLALDNFGHGYSTLKQVEDLPFVQLKLDRSFISDCGTDKVNAPICKSMIDLAHHFGSIAVAIGIENAADSSALISMGCDYGQGFLLGQAMPEAQFTSLLKRRMTPSAAVAKAG